MLQLRRFLLHAAHALLHRRRPKGTAPGLQRRVPAAPSPLSPPAGDRQVAVSPGSPPGSPHTHTHPQPAPLSVLLCHGRGEKTQRQQRPPPAVTRRGSRGFVPTAKGTGPGGCQHTHGEPPSPVWPLRGRCSPPGLAPCGVLTGLPPPSCSPHLFVPRAAEGEKP